MAIPNSLYKYRSITANSLSSLTNSTIWLANPSTFNDPFDCAVTLDKQRYEESIEHLFSLFLESTAANDIDAIHLTKERPEVQLAFENCRNTILNTAQNFGICSFSAIPDHILMWSHYADHHKGFCVEYDCSLGSLLQNFAREVIYQDDIPSLTTADFAPEMKKEVLESLWLVKVKCWSYEKEWRVLMSEGNKTYPIQSSRIISVTFGARMAESERLMITQSLMHKPDTKFKQAKLKENRYEIEILVVII